MDISVPGAARLFFLAGLYFCYLVISGFTFYKVNKPNLNIRRRRAFILMLCVTYLFVVPFIFADAYMLIQRNSNHCLTNYTNGYDAVYFSYTTFSTLGYGDIAPVGWCRALTSIEAMTGYLGMGMLIAQTFMLLSNSERKILKPHRDGSRIKLHADRKILTDNKPYPKRKSR